jgi:hypothetical protein
VGADEAVHSRRPAPLPHQRGDAHPLERKPPADGQPLVGVAAPGGDAGHRPVRLVAFHAREVGAGQQADLAGDRLEHLGGRRGLRNERCDPPQRGLLLGESSEFVAVCLQGAAHGVERALEVADLRHGGLGHADRQVAPSQPARHGGRATHGEHDRAGEVAGENDHQQDRAHKAYGGGRDRPAGVRVRLALAIRRQAPLGVHEAVEAGADGVNPPLAGDRRRHAACGRVAATSLLDERDGVIPGIRLDRARDSYRARLLLRVVRELDLSASFSRIAPERSMPGREEALPPGDDEAARAGLQIDDQRLELHGGRQLRSGVKHLSGRPSHVLDRQ